MRFDTKLIHSAQTPDATSGGGERSDLSLQYLRTTGAQSEPGLRLQSHGEPYEVRPGTDACGTRIGARGPRLLLRDGRVRDPAGAFPGEQPRDRHGRSLRRNLAVTRALSTPVPDAKSTTSTPRDPNWFGRRSRPAPPRSCFWRARPTR